MPIKTIDTHIHVWDFDRAQYSWLEGDTSILNKTYSLQELEAELIAAGITEGILVQAANNFEDTDWMLQVAEDNNWITAVVGWLPLMQPGTCSEVLENKYLLNKFFKGVRHLIHNEPSADWLLQPAVMESLEIIAQYGVPFDVVGIIPEHIETALAVAEKVPSLKMVFDHLNQPPIAAHEKFGRWGQLMTTASKHPNFYVKISGLGTTSGNFNNWNSDDIKPYVEFALERFGDDRCFCGGDWPVSLLAGSYTKTWNEYKKVFAELLDTRQQEKVLYDNAKQFYQIQ